ncbi:MAG: CapA family protein [Clostridiales bacterium]
MNKKFIIILLCIFVVISLYYIIFHIVEFENNKIIETNIKKTDKLENDLVKNTEKPKSKEISILALGDNLLHMPVINAMKIDNEMNYDFKPMFDFIDKKITDADISFINQETVTGGEKFGLSGYPTFNSPIELERDLVNLGFDVVNQATNHSLDKDGALEYALENWSKYKEVNIIGAANSQTQRDKATIVQREGVKIAFLGYTYGTNGIPLPRDKPYLVNIIDKGKIKNDIQRAKKITDIIVVSMHWGVEYMHQQSTEQEDLAEFLADQEVDLIIGHHPHVIQPVEKIKGINGNETVVAYSLGNMISCQDTIDKLLGGMLEVNITKDEEGDVKVEDVKVTPIVTFYNLSMDDFKIVPINKYTTEMTLKHYRDFMRQVDSIDRMKEISQTVLGEYNSLN